MLVQSIRKFESTENKSFNSTFDVVSKLLNNSDYEHFLKELSLLKYALKPISHIERKLFECEEDCFNKLGKCLVYKSDILAGKVLEKYDFSVKVSIVKGLSTNIIDELIGKRLNINVSKDSSVIYDHVEL